MYKKVNVTLTAAHSIHSRNKLARVSDKAQEIMPSHNYNDKVFFGEKEMKVWVRFLPFMRGSNEK